MKVLDFNNLKVKHQKLLNLISIDVQNDMIDLMDSLFNQSENNKFILLHPVFSRNPYQSDLFLTLCYLKLVDNLMKSTTIIEKIICNTIFEKKIINQKYKNLIVEYKTVTYSRKIIFTDIIKISVRSIYYIITKNIDRKVLSINNEYVLIDTFLTKKCIKKEKYNDRYYTDILKYIDKADSSNIFFLPSIPDFPSNKTISKIVDNSKENLIIKHDYLKLKDYLEVIIKLFKTSRIKYKSINFYDYDITDLINNELKIKNYNLSFFDGLLNYQFIKNLKSDKIKLKCLIDWNENQSIDKGLILGMKTFYPEVITKGYQGYIISTNYNHYIKPSKLEIKNNLIPDYIYVIGKDLQNRIKSHSKNLKVKIAPAYRFKNVFKKSSNKKIPNSILVILPIGLVESLNIIGMLIDSELLNSRTISLKPHPFLKFKEVINHFGSDKLKKINITHENINDLLQKHSITIGSASSALIESLIRYSPVLIIANKNIIQNPIPDSINSNIWKVCYTKQELLASLTYLEKYISNNYNDLKNESLLVKTNYFEKPTKQLTREFLGLEKN